MVQFKKGRRSIPILVITLISGYCTVHVYWSGIELYIGLILVRKGYKCSSTLARSTECMWIFIEM